MMADTPPETPTIVPATALGGVSTKMGFLGATSYVIGNIIGSGIFITPASILRSTESPGLSLIVWFLCAIIAILGMTMLPLLHRIGYEYQGPGM
uniref:Large neutral amino acids transporter small subunit 2 n=1 Tax=Bursaphelenchus xylophilus TaxID=6326 RepID=A0A1I7S7B1_BURXY